MERFQDKLNAIRDRAYGTISEADAASFRAEVEKLAAGDGATHAPRVGDKMPGFNLFSDTGEEHTLASLLEDGILIVSFNRGNWCPFCRAEVQALQQSMEIMNDDAVHSVIISPQLPERSAELRRECGLSMPILYDEGNVFARSIGLEFEEPDEVKRLHTEVLKIDMVAHYGTAEARIPIPAMYVVDRSGTILFSYINPNWQERAVPGDYLGAAG